MLKLVSILVRKASNYDDLLSQQKAMVQQFHTHPEKINIDSIVELSHEDFFDFKDDLMSEHEFIYKHRDEVILVKEKGADNYSGIIVHQYFYFHRI